MTDVIAYLKGKLAHCTSDSVIIDVNGVGYRVYTSVSSLGLCKEIGTDVKMYTHYYVREDTQALYGFLTMEELNMFNQLLTVSGVGPKVALSIVSYVQPYQFAMSVLSDDAECLTKVPGVGKKTAQRIILELKDKIKKEYKDVPEFETVDAKIPCEDNRAQEAVSALMMLGYSAQEARTAVNKAFDTDSSVEQIIKNALKQMIN